MSKTSQSPGFDGCMAELRKANATLDRINGHFRGIRETLFLMPLFVIIGVAAGVSVVLGIKALLF